MSTIKSSAEHLTLNADGSGNDIKFQSNGSEVASISDGGVVTATSFSGSGANLTGVGVAGISSSADATAITINSSEQVGIGIGSPTVPLQVRTALSSVTQSTPETVLLLETTATTGGDMAVGNGTRILFKIADDETNPSVGASIDAVRANGDDSISSTDLVFSTSQNDETLDEALRITNDGVITNTSGVYKIGALSTAGTTTGWNFDSTSATNISITSGASAAITTSLNGSGMILANDTSLSGETAIFVTGGGQMALIGGTSNSLVASNGPNSSQVGFFVSGGKVYVKNGMSGTLSLNIQTFRTRSGQ